MAQETVVFDGECGVCCVAVERVSAIVPASMVFRAYQSLGPDDLRGLGLTVAACARRVQFVNTAGRVSSGGTACADILARSTPPFAYVAVVARLPIVRSIVNAAYDVFAAHRATISRALGLDACRLPRIG
jgi:predicted DCC family thiol-disulfide oxidoreductase YuxK